MLIQILRHETNVWSQINVAGVHVWTERVTVGLPNPSVFRKQHLYIDTIYSHLKSVDGAESDPVPKFSSQLQDIT